MATEYYTRKQVLITGGSGVLGKGIIEKLLRSTEICHIYMLLRNKRNMSIEDRLKDFKDSIMFDRLKQEKPNALDKLSVIAGDICEPFLGISEESLKLIENVDILIHSAATVKFDEPIRDSIRKNVGGTFECVKVASKLKRLQLFVHVSTYYSNPYDLEVKNIMYPPPMDWKVALKLADGKSSDELLDSLSGKWTTKFPNTYTFTKNLAENVVNDHQHLFPVLITRPSVILCTRYEPIPGYTEKFQGVTGIIAFLGTGLLHSLYGKPHETLDVIWSDLVVNIHLLSIARIGLLEQKLSKPEIVLICAYPHDPFDLSSRMKYVVQSQEKLPFAKCFGFYSIKVVSCYYHYLLRVVLYQLLPSMLLDLLLRLFKIKPMLMTFQRKVFAGSKELFYFVSRSYRSAGITHQDKLFEMADSSVFKINSLYEQTSNANAKRSYDAFVLGNRKYLMKEKDSTLTSARRRYKIFVFLKYLKDIIFWVLVVKLASYYFNYKLF